MTKLRMSISAYRLSIKLAPFGIEYNFQFDSFSLRFWIFFIIASNSSVFIEAMKHNEGSTKVPLMEKPGGYFPLAK